MDMLYYFLHMHKLINLHDTNIYFSYFQESFSCFKNKTGNAKTKFLTKYNSKQHH